ncbi:hypothetical protein DFP72DRAFT_1103317 [Ephemerocybe angulata]|uniref:Uncharacterized protein n=1 Tax=Ephemerocybe angulata TaxID=980116 RepID=A0A8H6HBJ7_9AGAR|nr:hypothetical protein DFP72DRAFT_1103317 [Tulosesus angulatus]
MRSSCSPVNALDTPSSPCTTISRAELVVRRGGFESLVIYDCRHRHTEHGHPGPTSSRRRRRPPRWEAFFLSSSSLCGTVCSRISRFTFSVSISAMTNDDADYRTKTTLRRNGTDVVHDVRRSSTSRLLTFAHGLDVRSVCKSSRTGRRSGGYVLGGWASAVAGMDSGGGARIVGGDLPFLFRHSNTCVACAGTPEWGEGREDWLGSWTAGWMVFGAHVSLGGASSWGIGMEWRWGKGLGFGPWYKAAPLSPTDTVAAHQHSLDVVPPPSRRAVARSRHAEGERERKWPIVHGRTEGDSRGRNVSRPGNEWMPEARRRRFLGANGRHLGVAAKARVCNSKVILSQSISRLKAGVSKKRDLRDDPRVGRVAPVGFLGQTYPSLTALIWRASDDPFGAYHPVFDLSSSPEPEALPSVRHGSIRPYHPSTSRLTTTTTKLPPEPWSFQQQTAPYPDPNAGKTVTTAYEVADSSDDESEEVVFLGSRDKGKGRAVEDSDDEVVVEVERDGAFRRWDVPLDGYGRGKSHVPKEVYGVSDSSDEEVVVLERRDKGKGRAMEWDRDQSVEIIETYVEEGSGELSIRATGVPSVSEQNIGGQYDASFAAPIFVDDNGAIHQPIQNAVAGPSSNPQAQQVFDRGYHQPRQDQQHSAVPFGNPVFPPNFESWMSDMRDVFRDALPNDINRQVFHSPPSSIIGPGAQTDSITPYDYDYDYATMNEGAAAQGARMVGRRSIRSEDGARMGATAAFVSKERGAGCLALIATRHAQWGRSLERTIREVRRGDTGFRVREWAHSVRWAMVDMLGEARRGTDGTAGRGWTGVLGCGESDGDMMAKRPSGCQGVLSWWRWWAKVEPMEGGQRWDGRRQVGCGGDKAVVGDDGETPFGRQWSTLKEEYDEWRLEDEGGTTSAHSVHVREGGNNAWVRRRRTESGHNGWVPTRDERDRGYHPRLTEGARRSQTGARLKHPPHTIVCAYSAQSPLDLAIETRNFCSLIPAEFRPFCQQTLELCLLTFTPPPTSARRTSIHTVFVTQHHRTQHALNRSQTTQDASTLSRRTAIPVWQSSFLTFTAQALTPDRNASGCQQQHPVFRNKIRHVKTILVPYKPLSTSESPAMHTTTTHLATSGLERTGGRWRAAKRTHVDGPSSNPQVAYVIFSQLARRTDFCRVIAISPHPSPIPFRSVGLPACTIPPTPPSGLPSLAGRISVVTWSFSLTTVVTEYFECGRVPRRSRLLAHPLPINSTALAECEGALACFEVHSTTSQSHPSPRIHFYCYFVKETLTELTLAPPYRRSGKKSPFWVVRVPEVRRSANPKIPIVCVISTGVPESVQYRRFMIGCECALTPADFSLTVPHPPSRVDSGSVLLALRVYCQGAAKLVIKTWRHQHPTSRTLGPEALSSKSSTLAQYEIRIRRRLSVQDVYPADIAVVLVLSVRVCAVCDGAVLIAAHRRQIFMRQTQK